MQVNKTWVHRKCMDEWLAFSKLLLLLALVNKPFTLLNLLLMILYLHIHSNNKHAKHTTINHQAMALKQHSSFSCLSVFRLIEKVQIN